MTILVAVVALALVAPAGSRADLLPTLDYVCDPPVPAAATNCANWHTSPVTLQWIFDPSLLQPVPGSDCASPVVIATDTPGTDVTCSVTSIATGTLTETATVRVDTTPPTVTGAMPARPPDHDGWWNHPVAFAFGGSDATSGIANCANIVYSGPDSAAAHVTGVCRDVAGNSTEGSEGIKYDATPPEVTPVPSTSRNGEVNLRWTASPDAVSYTVTREPGHDGPQPTMVYTGPSQEYNDNKVNEQKTYTYTITANDAAANSSSVVMIAVPGGSQMVLGTRETVTPQAAPPPQPPASAGRTYLYPRLRWRRVPKADYYNVQVFRGSHKILSAWPRRTHLQLRQRWTFRGQRHRLTPGRYKWYAWPGFGNRRAHRYGRMITHKKFTIPRQA